MKLETARGRPGPQQPQPLADGQKPRELTTTSLRKHWQALTEQPANEEFLLRACAAIRSLGATGPAALPALATLGKWLGTANGHDDARWPESVAQRVETALVLALAAAARSAPGELEAFYEQADTLLVRDCACEAAGHLGQSQQHPALLRLQVNHLGSNPAVAALTLADYGDLAAVAPLQLQLQRELDAPKPASATAVAALEEALQSFGCAPLPAASPAGYGRHQSQAGKMKVVAGWLHRLEDGLAPKSERKS